MTCAESIQKGLCLGCTRVETENPNANNCKYKDNGLDMCKKILKGDSNVRWRSNKTLGYGIK